ncbi:diguanylate cyclase [Halomonas sp. CH40]
MDLPLKLYKETLEHISEAITITDAHIAPPGPRIVYVNRAFEAMTGYLRSEVLGISPRILQGPSSSQEVLKRLQDDMRKGISFEGETYNYRKNGTVFLMKWSVTPVKDSAGQITHFVAVQRDITEQRERQHRREQLEEVTSIQRMVVTSNLDLQRVREKVVEAALAMTNADAAVVAEAEGQELVYRAVEGAAKDSLGLRLLVSRSLSGLSYRKQEVLRCDNSRIDNRVELKEAAEKIGFISGILAPLVHEQNCYGVLKVYSSKPMAFNEEDCQLLELASGTLASALFNAAAFDTEISRRTLLVDSFPMLVSYIDREQRYQEMNAAYEQWFDVIASEIRGKYVWEVLGNEAYETVRPHLSKALSGESVSYEARVLYRTGGEREIHARYEPHFLSNGSVAGVYAVIWDMTKNKQAELDFLTGIFNRRKFDEIVTDALKTATRYEQPVTLAMLDIDYFKAVNDYHGHLVGDQVIKEVSQRIVSMLRNTDTLARWGGEEFIILSPGINVEQGIQLAERVRKTIGSKAFAEVGPITISIGVAQWFPGETLSSLQARADRALYMAKETGRNKVCV